MKARILAYIRVVLNKFEWNIKVRIQKNVFLNENSRISSRFEWIFAFEILGPSRIKIMGKKKVKILQGYNIDIHR